MKLLSLIIVASVTMMMVLLAAPTPAEAGDIAKARELFTKCQELLDAGQACKAARTCRKGLKEAALEPLKKLEKEANKRCRGASKGKDRDGDGIPDKVDRCKKSPEDIDGFQDDDGCPETDNDEDGIEDGADSCPDDPEDRDDFEDEDGCPDLDHDKDGVNDDVDQCLGVAEDEDGHQDKDGCPDEDNDGDGFADADDECPDTPEDMDGREDDDGCPDLDHDGDGIVEGIDRCPDDKEDVNGYEDEDGCPDGGQGPSVWGWVVGGSGVGLVAGGIVLTVVGLGVRGQVEALEDQAVPTLTQREAQAKAEESEVLTASGLALLSVGTVAVAAGAIILAMTWNSTETSSSFFLTPTLVDSPDAGGIGGGGLQLVGRF